VLVALQERVLVAEVLVALAQMLLVVYRVLSAVQVQHLLFQALQ
jgi:hypothetical protein